MTHGRLGRPRPGGVEHGRRCIFVGIAPRFRLERALAQSPSSHGVGRGPSPEVICRGIRPKPREIGIPEVIYGESRPRPRRSRAGRAVLPDGRERNICRFPDGNRLCANSTPRFGGELATNEPYAHFAAGGQPSSGARSGMRLRRAGPMAGLSRFSPKLRPVFQAKRGATDAEGARRRREGRAVPGPSRPGSDRR